MSDNFELIAKAISKNNNISLSFSDSDSDFKKINQNNFLFDSFDLPDQNSFSKNRALVDLASFYYGYHDFNNHKKYTFDSVEEQKLFDNLEKVRLIILASSKYLGISKNLKDIIEDEILCLEKIEDFAYILAIESCKILENITISEEIINISQKNTKHLKKLIKKSDNQEKFSILSDELIKKIFRDENKNDLKDKDGHKNLIDKSKDNQKDKQFSNKENENNLENNNKKEEEVAPKKIDINLTIKNPKEGSAKNQNIDNDKYLSFGGKVANSNPKKQGDLKFIKKYQIFTKKFDVTTRPLDLIDKNELIELRSKLDDRIKELPKISAKLKAKLKRKLLAKKNINNHYNKEEGLINSKKLSGIITSPLKKDNYLQVIENNNQNSAITFLIDNSGSMRGFPINMSAMVTEVIVDILEKFSIKTEILGFTTMLWRGGKSKKYWQSGSKNKNPGRLSDLCHVIYKKSNESLKKAKLNLSLMLKNGFLKENIDGEALLFASKRLCSLSENRKILIIISDGAPIDDSTNSNNDDKNILIDHLHQVITTLQKKSNIEIIAIGIGHDVGEFYKNSITIKKTEELGDVLIKKLLDIL